MAGKNVLVPFNFTDYDEKVLHYVIRTFAGQKWAKVTLFHVYTPLPEVNGYNPSLARLKGTMASLSKELREKEGLLKRTRQDLLDNGFSANRVDTIFRPRVKGVGGEIVEAALRESYNTIVLSRRPSRMIRAFTRNIHDKILSSLKDREIVIIT
jgi:hypothetical protein